MGEIFNRKFGEKIMNCKRCEKPLKYIGVKKFHEGAKVGFFGDLAELLTNREEFHLYTCLVCGEVSFFLKDIERQKFERSYSGEDTKNEVLKKYGKIKNHPLFETYLDEDMSRKYLSQKDREERFLVWLKSRKNNS